MNDLPAFFYLEPGINTAILPIGAEFDCVFGPEQTTGDGWVKMRFRVVLEREIRPPFDYVRQVMPIRKKALTEDEARALYQQLEVQEV